MSNSNPSEEGKNNKCLGDRGPSSMLQRNQLPLATTSDADLDQADREALTCSVLCSLMGTTNTNNFNHCRSSKTTPSSVPQHIVSSSAFNNSRSSNSCSAIATTSNNNLNMNNGYCDNSRMNNCDRDSQASESELCDYGGPSGTCGQMSECGGKQRRSAESCTEHLQLPMFLSKTYHMIDRCDDEIAMWSEKGDNFVVKNVEKFASHVLPLYFKHSNFSSFARQLNFYGFRKLRTDPILTSDVDPCTSCFVRFYHEKFQRGKPELLQHIKRATKTDQHSKDDIESLRNEISDLKDCLRNTVDEYDRKLAELSYECNRRITAMNAEYDNLAALVHRVLGGVHQQSAAAAAAAIAQPPASSLSSSASQLHNPNPTGSTSNGSMIPPPCTSFLHSLCPSYRASAPTQPANSGGSLSAGNHHHSLTPTAAAASSASASQSLQLSVNSDLLHSLSQAAVSIQNSLRAQQQQHQHFLAAREECGGGGKRAVNDSTDTDDLPRCNRPKREG